MRFEFSGLVSVCVCVFLCRRCKPEHINGAGRTREQNQTQEGRSSAQINLHWMAQQRSRAIFGSKEPSPR